MKKLLCAVMAAVAVVGSASAVYVPTDWTTASADITTEVGGAVTAGLVIFGVVLAALIGIKLFKRVVNKA